MKKIVLTFALAAFAFVSVNAQEAAPAAKKEHKKSHKMEKMAMKKHVCTAACKDGKHAYAHGEEGHVCTDACKKMEKKS